MKMPSNVINQDRRTAAYSIPANLLEEAYTVSMQELKSLVSGAITFDNPWADNSISIQRWLGSEKWFYGYVKILGGRLRRTTHGRYAEIFDRDYLAGTEKPPVWMRNSQVWRRYVAEVTYWDDYKRLANRWPSMRRRGNVPDYRRQARSHRLSEFDFAIRLELDTTPNKLTTDHIRTLFQRYRGLYRISFYEFLNRNRFRGLVYNPRRVEARPYIQRVASYEKINEVLTERRAKVDRESEQRSWRAATATFSWRAATATFSDWVLT